MTKYLDARTVQQEIADANNMTQEEINMAARMLVNHSPGQGPYLNEHLGGFSAEELKDYNQYSDKLNRRRHKPSDYVDSYEDDSDEQTVFVTSL